MGNFIDDIEFKVACYMTADHRARLLAEWLDEENFIVNCDTNIGLDDATTVSSQMADDAVELLEKYYHVDGMEWHKHSEPNWWDKDGDETDEEDAVSTVQFQIYQQDV